MKADTRIELIWADLGAIRSQLKALSLEARAVEPHAPDLAKLSLLLDLAWQEARLQIDGDMEVERKEVSLTLQ